LSTSSRRSCGAAARRNRPLGDLRAALLERIAVAAHRGEAPLPCAAEVVRTAFGVDRVSVARIDSAAGSFEIVAESGARLLAPGTVLPVDTCSYFAGAPDGRVFGDGDFDASAGFRRPLDGVILAAGFHSGCSVPIRRGGSAVAALSLSAGGRRVEMPRLADVLEGVGDVLLPALDVRPAPDPGLTQRERQLLGLLDEGLRFKQIARRLGVSEATAKTHGRNLFRKLDASSRAEAVHLARERGLLH
jgi:DNA-binding CsgD family transcriptional regulator